MPTNGQYIELAAPKTISTLSQGSNSINLPSRVSLADSRGLILAAPVGKHPSELIEERVVTTEAKTECKRLNRDDGRGYEGVLPPAIEHYIGKDRTQR